MKKVLFTRKITEKALKILDKHKNIYPIYLPQDKVHEKDIIYETFTKNQDIQGILCIANDKIDKKLLLNAPKLKCVSTISVGFDHIDLKSCKELGIKVGHTPDTVTEATADISVALLLAVARRLTEGIEMAKTGDFPTLTSNMGFDVFGKTIGVIGLGRIGRAFCKRMNRGFNCKILYYTPSGVKKDFDDEFQAEYCDMDTLLSKSDFVSLHCSLNDSTREFFNKDLFSKMKKNSILINTTRGGVIQQDDLYDALKNNQIYGAGLDVTSPEPLPKDHKLLTLKNCLILPHIGTNTIECRDEMCSLALNNLIHCINDQDMITPLKF